MHGAPSLLFLLVGLGHIWLLIFLAFNFLPAIIAFARGHRHPWLILVIDFLLGWTVIAWVGTLVWALVGERRYGVGGRPGAAVGMLSPDGRWWWDGSRWVPVSGPPPPPG